MQKIRLFTLLFSLLLLLLIGCHREEGGCQDGVDECGVCGGNDYNNDNYCQLDIDILQAFKNANNSLNSTALENIGYQIWDDFIYNGMSSGGWEYYQDVSYRRLVMLDLSFNQITNIPHEISNFRFGKLTELNLNGNQIVTIPESICLLNAYSIHINLGSNTICNESIHSCFEENNNGWNIDNQDQSNCCKGSEGQPNWTECPE